MHAISIRLERRRTCLALAAATAVVASASSALPVAHAAEGQPLRLEIGGTVTEPFPEQNGRGR